MAKPDFDLHNPAMLELPGNLRIHSAGYVSHSRSSVWDTLGPLPDHDLVTILGGVGKFTWDDGHATLQAGDCIICRRGRHYVQTMDSKHRVTEVWIHFDFLDDHGRRLDEAVKKLPHVVYGIEDMPFFRNLLLRAVEAFTQKESTPRAPFWLQGALLELLRQNTFDEIAGPARERHAAIRCATMEILANAAGPWRIDELARKHSLSTDHFCRLFNKINGISPGKFILNSRIELAKQHLRGTSLSIGEIADRLGYCTIYAFSRQFKQKIGIAPSEYRSRRG